MTDLPTLHRRPAQGGAARAPRRLGLAPDRGRAGRPARGRTPVPADPDALADYFAFRDFAPLHRGLPQRRRPDPRRRGRPHADLRGGPGAGPPAGPLRRADRHAVLARAAGASRRRRSARRSRTPAGAAEAEFGVVLRWCFDIPGEAGLPAAEETLRIALDERPDGLVSFGLGGPEIGVPRPQFKPYFDQARAAGLRSVPHAGETTGPQTDLGRAARAGRRADRARHLRRAGPAAAGLPGRAADPAGGVPDLERAHPGRGRPRRAPAAAAGRGRACRSPSTPTTRRCSAPPSTTSTRSRPACSSAGPRGVAGAGPRRGDRVVPRRRPGRPRIGAEIDRGYRRRSRRLSVGWPAGSAAEPAGPLGGRGWRAAGAWVWGDRDSRRARGSTGRWVSRGDRPVELVGSCPDPVSPRPVATPSLTRI